VIDKMDTELLQLRFAAGNYQNRLSLILFIILL